MCPVRLASLENLGVIARLEAFEQLYGPLDARGSDGGFHDGGVSLR
jgi:hypothetical protein